MHYPSQESSIDISVMANQFDTNNETNGVVMRAWRRLRHVRWLSLTAEPGPESATGWRGQGSARVGVRLDGDDRRLIENGRFLPAGEQHSLPFHNVYRWRRDSDRLRIYHERFGAEAAVYLFDLVAAGHNRLDCEQPHRCGDDTYHGSLVLTRDGFDFRWSIAGPRKDENLFYRYQCQYCHPAM